VDGVRERGADGGRVIAELARELAAVGIRGRLRARILAEVDDHLRCDPEGVARFGEPKAVAARFAEELAPVEARRAARGSFAALALVGAAYALVFLQLTTSPPEDVLGGRQAGVGLAAAVGLILLPQVAFVAGVLAPLGRSPRAAVRRAGVGLAAGAGSLACALVFAWEFRLHTAVLWATLPALCAVAGAGALAVRAARIRPAAAPAGDLFDDLGPLVPAVLRGRPWRFALVVTGLAAVAVGIAGASGGDPGEGVRNAVAESTACLGCFALLGRYLGLRR
jgi:hypothetical protein